MVNFSPTEEQELLRQTLAGFAREVLRPRRARPTRRTSCPTRLVAKGWELGLVQSSIPEAFGGFGEPALGGHRRARRSRSSPTAASRSRLHLLAPRLVTVPLARSPARTRRRSSGCRASPAPTFAAGTAAFIEPRWDFDPTALATTRRARRAATGCSAATKCLVPLADRRRGDPRLRQRARRPRRVPRRARRRGPHDRRAREEHGPQGARHLPRHARRRARAGRRAASAATAPTCTPLVDAQPRRQRGAGGRRRRAPPSTTPATTPRSARRSASPIAQKQAIAFMLADMAIEIDAMRLLAWEAAWRLDQRRARDARGVPGQAVRRRRRRSRSPTTRVQVLGGHGYIRDHLVELLLRNARGFATFDGLAIV